MTNGKLALGVALVAVVIAIGGIFLPKLPATSQALGAGSRWPNGISANSNAPSIAGQVRGTSLKLDTTNSATSTAAVGCVQTTATSTATPIRLLYTASTTANAISGTQSGFVLWGYGSCPF